MSSTTNPNAATASGDDKHVAAMRSLASTFRATAPLDLSIELWNGERLGLSQAPSDDLAIGIRDPRVIASLIKRPTLDRLIQHYAHGNIDLKGGTIIDLGRRVDGKDTRRALRKLPKAQLLRILSPFLWLPGLKPSESRAFGGDQSGEQRAQADNRDFIQFHYDVGNDFYALFLDPELQYSCGYFTDWDNTLEQCQRDKIDMICRKLRLKPGDRMLDIGCGWGGLICHAAKEYGAVAHGITLSDEQLKHVLARAEREGIADRVTAEIRDYADLAGTYDKISSIGMYEHVGLKNIDTYFQAVRRVLATDGVFLNHAISRKAKRKQKRFSSRAEQRALQKYIFPGGELDDIGHTVAAMERAGFEVHDVEGWRTHYARTTELWCERLTARRDEAIALVGPETYRIWVAYLGGCSLAFNRGSARIFQTVATYHAKGPTPLPPTRADLYR